jgi:hypothetical protein
MAFKYDYLVLVRDNDVNLVPEVGYYRVIFFPKKVPQECFVARPDESHRKAQDFPEV